MTTKPTHSTRLARLASRDGTLTYAKALELVRRAHAEKRLPEILDDEGMQASLEILRLMRDEEKAKSLPQAAPHLVRVLLGHDHDRAPFFLDATELSMHTLVLGSVGAGETVALQTLISGMLDLGWSGTVLDLDGDISTGGLREFCMYSAQFHGIDFQQVSSEISSPNWLNPLAGLDSDEAGDLLLSLTSIDDAYWQTITKRLLGQLVNLCYDAHRIAPEQAPYPTVSAIGSILEQGNLNAATKKLRSIVASGRPGVDMSPYSTLSDPDPDAQKIAAGLGAKLSQLYDTQAGQLVLSSLVRARHSEFDPASSGVTYLGVDSLSRPDLALLVGSSVLARVSALARSTIMSGSGPTRRFLVVTRAGTTDYPHLAALLSKARAGGIAVVLSDQSPLDWETDAFERVSQNINIRVVMSQSTQHGAQACAELLGQPGPETAHNLRQLGIGEAEVRIIRPESRSELVSVTFTPSPPVVESIAAKDVHGD